MPPERSMNLPSTCGSRALTASSAANSIVSARVVGLQRGQSPLEAALVRRQPHPLVFVDRTILRRGLLLARVLPRRGSYSSMFFSVGVPKTALFWSERVELSPNFGDGL